MGSDPGLLRFRLALATTISTILAFGTEYLFVHLTGALQAPVPKSASPALRIQIEGSNHAGLIVALLIGGLIALYSGTSINEPTKSRTLVSALLLPIPLVVTFLPSLTLGKWRTAILISMPLVLGVGTLARRYGPRGTSVGLLGFMGEFFGYFLHTSVPLSEAIWVIAAVADAMVCTIVVRVILLPPQPQQTLLRTLRAYAARGRAVLRTLEILLEEPSDRHHQQLAESLVRFNNTAIVVDGILPEDDIASGSLQSLKQLVFDIELALSNSARFFSALLSEEVDPQTRSSMAELLRRVAQHGGSDIEAEIASTVAGWQKALPKDPITEILLRRLRATLNYLGEAIIHWRAHSENLEQSLNDTTDLTHLLRPPLAPNTGTLSAKASLAQPQSRYRRPLSMTRRIAIQITIASGLAIAVGDIIDPPRFYWAPIAALLCFLGANSSGEQIVKGLYRVLGTMVGIVIGLLIGPTLGHNDLASLAIIVLTIFVGVYLLQVNYAFLAVSITVAISLLYVQLNEFTTALLLTRLEETFVGACCGILVALAVVPLGAHRLLVTNLEAFLGAVRDLIREAFDPDHAGDLSPLLHEVDAQYHSLLLVAKPMNVTAFGEHRSEDLGVVSACGGSRNYLRSLTQDVMRGRLKGTSVEIPTEVRHLIDSSIAELQGALNNNGANKVYLRFSSQVDQAQQRYEAEHPNDRTPLYFRDLTLIDGSLAALALSLGVRTYSFDARAELSAPRR